MKRIKTSFKPNFFVALLIGGWLFLFIILIKPFQLEELNAFEWFTLAGGHSLIALLSYLLILPIQNKVFEHHKKWSIEYEVLLFISFYSVAFIPSYLFHKSDLHNGIYSLTEFFIMVFLPSLLVVTPLIIFARIYLLKMADETNAEVIIKGTYKMDYLKVGLENLVCVSSSQNYVDVYYLANGVLNKKTIRTSLKKIENEIPALLRVHRSHLINLDHFVSWKDNKTIALTQIEIPVSKNYKERLIAI